jgi:hypothetical protein
VLLNDNADVPSPSFKKALESNSNQGQYLISYIEAIIHLSKLDVARTVLEQGEFKGL